MSPHDRPVLVVEDDPALRAYMVAAIERQGFECVAAASGEEALELLGGREAQLAVLDVGQPEMDAFAVADELDGVPVIIVTGDPVTAYARAGELKNEYEVLPKTMMPDVFESAVARSAERR
jgi:DNA-binding response OmpR family regulator